MGKKLQLTPEAVREVLDYDPETGIFRWKLSRGRAPAGAVAGHPHPQGYWAIRVFTIDILAHQLAWFYVYGVFPPEIDHKNRDKRDNRLSNLRECSHPQNQWNVGALRSNKTGIKGVSLHKSSGLYRARLRVNNTNIMVGYFKTLEEAAAAYRQRAQLEHGEFYGHD